MKDVAHSSWKVLKCVKRDNHPTIKRGCEPEMEGVVGYAGERDKPPSDDGEVASSTITMVCIIPDSSTSLQQHG